MSGHPSGEQHEIRGHGYRAVVTEVGASLRELRAGGRDLVVPWSADEVRPVNRGALLAPWPNRVADGQWCWLDEPQQLALNEPARSNAIHGLVQWLPWVLQHRDDARVSLGCRVFPQAGYPGRLDLAVTYALDVGGLTTTLTATNAGAADTPYGCAPHPYLVAGPGRVDDWDLELPASRVLEVDAERLLPARPPVTRLVHGDLDFRSGRRVGGTALDHAYTGVAPRPDGRAAVRVSHLAERTGVEISWDPAVMPWVQVHTADRPEPALDRVGAAVEPMTCPPDAFGSGTDLVVLRPGQVHQAAWTLTALARG